MHQSVDKSPTVEIWNLTSSLCSACLDGDYTHCHCDDPVKLRKEVSKDSLDQISTPESPGNQRHSFHEELLSDNEFEDQVEFENTCRPLPPSTTDWDTIESVLENELHDEDEVDAPSISPDSTLNRSMKYRVKNMQMVFVDNEDDETDVESEPDVEVFYEDSVEMSNKMSGSSTNLKDSDRYSDTERNIESRDSGYITADVYDIAIEKVTDFCKNSDTSEPVEESSRILASLQIHEEHEVKKRRESERQRQKEHEKINAIHARNIKELKEIKMILEEEIEKINMELVQELMVRDELHSRHQALLMEADDLTKTSKQKCNEKTTKKVTSKKSLWKR